MPIIRIENLRKSYGSAVAVDGISFSVQAGECFGLLGPNGAGKTTTIRMIYGFTPPDSGLLRIFGSDCNLGWRTVKSRIGVCQQDNNLDPDLTVLENLQIFASYFNLPKAIVRERVADHCHEGCMLRPATLEDVFLRLTGRDLRE